MVYRGRLSGPKCSVLGVISKPAYYPYGGVGLVGVCVGGFVGWRGGLNLRTAKVLGTFIAEKIYFSELWRGPPTRLSRRTRRGARPAFMQELLCAELVSLLLLTRRRSDKSILEVMHAAFSLF